MRVRGVLCGGERCSVRVKEVLSEGERCSVRVRVAQ